MSNQDLTAKVLEYQQYKRIKEDAETMMKSLQAQITAHMEEQGKMEMTVDVFKVSYKPVVSTRLDSKALKIAQPALYAQFCTTSATKRFVVR